MKVFKILLTIFIISAPLYASLHYKIDKGSDVKNWTFQLDQSEFALTSGPVSLNGQRILPLSIRVPFEIKASDFAISVLEKRYLNESDAGDEVKLPAVHSLGNFRGVSTYSFQFYPLGRDKNGRYLILKGRIELKNLPAMQNKTSGIPDPVLERVFDKSEIPFAEKISKNKTKVVTQVKKSTGQVKLFIEKKGLYRFSGSDLAEAGVDLSEIDPRSLKLYNQGIEISILVNGEADGRFDENDYVEFFGTEKLYDLADRFPEAKDNDLYFDPFTRYNVYWLDWGSGLGLRMVDESGEIQSTDPADYFKNSFFVEQQHFESNNSFDALGTVDVNQLSFFRDHYFYDRGVAQGKKNSYKFQLNKPLRFSGGYEIFVGLKVALTGITTVTAKDHNASIFLNNSLIFQPFSGWQDQDFVVLENFTDINNNLFLDGENTLEVTVPDQGYTDQVTLNWFEISYLRSYTAVNNQLVFALSPEAADYPDRTIQQFEIDGFTDPNIRIYKNGLSRFLNFIKSSYIDEKGQTKFKVKFQDKNVTSQIKYFAIAGDNRLKPDLIEIEFPSFADNPGRSLYDITNSADFLIITHRNFENFSSDYADYRRQNNGFDVEVVLVEDIYDEFNYGIKSPIGIKDFIKYAYYNWNQYHKLAYVLLVGDADGRYLDRIDQETDFVPTFLFQTYKRGASATDHEYALLEGVDVFDRSDSFADIFIGRLPVKTNNELQAYFNKVKEYENPENNLGDWTSKNLFISGNDSRTLEQNLDLQPAFRSQNNRVIAAQLPNGLAAYRLNTVQNDSIENDRDFGGTVTLSNYINDGLAIINFLGHGGGGIWADVNLMNLTDVDRLLNKGKYPFITSMTCFTGQFESNSQPGLMEKMVLAEDKGAIAAFASSGLGWLQNDYAVLWDIFSESIDRNLTFGETMVLNKAYYLTYHRYYADDFFLPADGFGLLGRSMVHQYNLIGDPVIKLNLPDEKLNVHLENQLFTDTLIFTLVIDDPKWRNSSGYYQVTDSQRRSIYDRPLLTTSEDTLQLSYSSDFIDKTGSVVLYLNNGTEDGTIGIPFAVNNAIMDTIIYDPPAPEVSDAIDITWIFNTKEEINSVFFKYERQNAFELQKISDTAFRLPSPLGPYSQRETIVYSLTLNYTNGNSEKYMGFKLDIINRSPDLAIVENLVKIEGGSNIKLNYIIKNNGLVPSDSFKVACFVNNQIFSFDSLSLKGREQTRRLIEFPFTLNDGTMDVKIYTDYYNEINEPDKSNNIVTIPLSVDRLYFAENLGTSYDGMIADTLKINGYAKLFAGNTVINNTATVLIDTTYSDFDGGDDIRIPFAGSSNRNILFTMENENSQLNDSFDVELSWDKDYVSSSGISQDQVSLFVYSPKFGQWSLSSDAKYDTLNGRATISIKEFSGFAFAVNNDKIEPFVEVTVDGYSLNKSTPNRKIFVSKSPKLSFIFQDDKGINLSSSNFAITVDGETVNNDELLFSGAVENAKTIGLTYYPQFSSGEHNLSVKVEDVSGNIKLREYTFKVESEFKINIIGVFPNPFTFEHDFCYVQFELNQPVSAGDFSASVYTLSGRKIRDFDGNIEFDAPLQNIKSLKWDGKDKYGIGVANGVYFIKLKVKSSDSGKTLEQTVKVAKLF